MKFNVDSKTFVSALNSVLLRGKYPSGSSYRMKSLSNYVYLIASNSGLQLCNADDTTACSLLLPQATIIENGEVILDITKTVKYLKTFSNEISVTVTDFIYVETDNKRASMSVVVSHPCYSMIEKIRKIKLPADGSMPSFGKSNTKFEARITSDASSIIEAAISCDAIGMGRYMFDYNGEDYIISASQNGIEKISTDVSLISHEGEEATVEIAGPFASFLDNITITYLKDEFPVMWICPNRMLIKAPRIEGR